MIPVLLADAKMPAREDLPSNLVPLVRKHAFSLSPAHFKSDAEELVRNLKQVLKNERVETRSERLVPPVSGSWALRVVARPRGHRSPPRPPPSRRTRRQESTVVNPNRARLKEDAEPPAGRLDSVVWGGRAGWFSAASVWCSSPSASPSLCGSCHNLATLRTLRSRADRLSRSRLSHCRTISSSSAKNATVSDKSRRSIWRGRLSGPSSPASGNTNPMLTPDRRTVLYLQQAKTGGPTTLRAMSADGQGDQALFADGSGSCPLLNRPAIRADNLLVVACPLTRVDAAS